MYYMFFADGFEEIEALGTLDLLRRADINVKSVGVRDLSVTGTHEINVCVDMVASDLSLADCEGIILPGGMPGTENLYADKTVIRALDFCYAENKLIGAICAAPIILGRKGYLKNINAVCFPGFEDELIDADVVSDRACVEHGNIITAKGAGCVFEFASAIIKYVCDADTANKVISTVQYKGNVI